MFAIRMQSNKLGGHCELLCCSHTTVQINCFGQRGNGLVSLGGSGSINININIFIYFSEVEKRKSHYKLHC